MSSMSQEKLGVSHSPSNWLTNWNLEDMNRFPASSGACSHGSSPSFFSSRPWSFSHALCLICVSVSLSLFGRSSSSPSLILVAGFISREAAWISNAPSMCVFRVNRRRQSPRVVLVAAAIFDFFFVFLVATKLLHGCTFQSCSTCRTKAGDLVGPLTRHGTSNGFFGLARNTLTSWQFYELRTNYKGNSISLFLSDFIIGPEKQFWT